MKVLIDTDSLIEQIAAGIYAGLNRDGWLPADLAACQRPNETVSDMRMRFALERAKNIAMPIMFEAEMAAEDAQESVAA